MELRPAIPFLVAPLSHIYFPPLGNRISVYQLQTEIPAFFTLDRTVQLYLLHPHNTHAPAKEAASLLGIEGKVVGIRDLGCEVVELAVQNDIPHHEKGLVFIRCKRKLKNTPITQPADGHAVIVHPRGTIEDRIPPSFTEDERHSNLPSIDNSHSVATAGTNANSHPQAEAADVRNDSWHYYPASAFGPPSPCQWQHYQPPSAADWAPSDSRPHDSRFHASMWTTSPPSTRT
ncbi:hypothetical protein FKP32DRAFT_442886 [Trametes sanguinea]|nr:hypothetical protein FKP32DRAFT_442886 [Trametes sanguinea]